MTKKKWLKFDEQDNCREQMVIVLAINFFDLKLINLLLCGKRVLQSKPEVD